MGDTFEFILDLGLYCLGLAVGAWLTKRDHESQKQLAEAFKGDGRKSQAWVESLNIYANCIEEATKYAGTHAELCRVLDHRERLIGHIANSGLDGLSLRRTRVESEEE